VTKTNEFKSTSQKTTRRTEVKKRIQMDNTLATDQRRVNAFGNTHMKSLLDIAKGERVNRGSPKPERLPCSTGGYNSSAKPVNSWCEVISTAKADAHTRGTTATDVSQASGGKNQKNGVAWRLG